MREPTPIRRTTVVVIIAVLTVSVLGVAPIAANQEPPPPPHSFHGEVAVVEEPVPAGTQIVALIDGEARGEIVADENGTYGGPTVGDKKLVVRGESGDEGKTITFLVNGVEANQTATWEAGGNMQLNFKFDELPAPPSGGGGGGGFGAPPSDTDDGDETTQAGSGGDETGDTETADGGSDTTDESANQAADGDDSDDSSMPGFGVTAALIGLLVTAGLVGRQR